MTVFLTDTKQNVMEVLSGPERPRRWSADEELATLALGSGVWLGGQFVAAVRYPAAIMATAWAAVTIGIPSKRLRLTRCL